MNIPIANFLGMNELSSILVTPTIIDFNGTTKDNFTILIKEIDYQLRIDKLQEQLKEIKNNVLPEINIDALSLEELIKYKVNEFNMTCTQLIYDGSDVELSTGTSHFSFTDQDQVNIKSAFDIAYATGLPVPYHANSQYCTIYKASDMIKIYGAMQTLITYQTTYCNAVNNYIRQSSDIELIKNFKYGTSELPLEIQKNIQDILSHAQLLLQAVLQNAKPDIDPKTIMNNL